MLNNSTPSNTSPLLTQKKSKKHKEIKKELQKHIAILKIQLTALKSLDINTIFDLLQLIKPATALEIKLNI